MLRAPGQRSAWRGGAASGLYGRSPRRATSAVKRPLCCGGVAGARHRGGRGFPVLLQGGDAQAPSAAGSQGSQGAQGNPGQRPRLRAPGG